MDVIEKYLEKTGQDRKELLAGAATYGPTFILDQLIPQALEENKKIVWIPDLKDGEDVGLVRYELQDI